MKPTTRYTKSGSINIAYQVFGSGDKDLVYIPGWISNIDLMWDCPELVEFFTELSKVVRIILFDKRGTGLSDRVSDLSTLEERMDDIRAVMDAVNSKKAILFGHSEGGSVSILFSATYPDRTDGLITFGVFAKRRWSNDYPWAPTDEARQIVYDMIDNHWGSGEMDLVSLAPSMKDNSVFMDWLARYFRSGASPSAAMALTKMNTQIDIREVLESVEVPTLLLYRKHDIDVKVEEGRYIASRIKGSKLIEFPGNDHLFWAGDSKVVLEHMVHFIENDCTERKYNKVLSTVLKIKIYQNDSKTDSQSIRNNLQLNLPFENLIEEKIHQYLGNTYNKTDEFITATFAGPSKAVHCAMDIQEIALLHEVDISQGLHIGEIGISGPQDDEGITLKITQKILDHAQPNQILITNTINNLLSGAGLYFSEFGVLTISNTRKLEILQLNNVDQNSDQLDDPEEFHFAQHTTRNHSLLEDVIQCIETNITDENFSMQTLSREIGVSPRQLQRRIKAITNKSPNNLIRSVRLHKAKEMIVQEGKSVKEAAFMTGFNSISYFSSCFKKEFGIPPSSV